MVSIFSTGKANNKEIKSFKDPKLKQFVKSVHQVMLNLAKRVASDGEGATKFITINCLNSKTESDAKNICFSIANSPLVKTAFFAEDPNWGRIAMAIGKSDASIKTEKLSIYIGSNLIFNKGKLVSVSVTDILSDGLSAVYSFYDPFENKRSLGTYSILYQTRSVFERELSYLYLGYWVKNCRKMDYKLKFRPLQMLNGTQWITIN